MTAIEWEKKISEAIEQGNLGSRSLGPVNSFAIRAAEMPARGIVVVRVYDDWNSSIKEAKYVWDCIQEVADFPVEEVWSEFWDRLLTPDEISDEEFWGLVG